MVYTLLAPALMDSICSRYGEKLFFSILRRVVPESGVISNPTSFENCKDRMKQLAHCHDSMNFTRILHAINLKKYF